MVQRCQFSWHFLISENFARNFLIPGNFTLYKKIGKYTFSGIVWAFQEMLTIVTGISGGYYLEFPVQADSYQGRIQEVAHPGAKWVINFGALEQNWRMSPSHSPPPPSNMTCQFSTPEVFFPGAPACAWNCLHGAPLVMLIYNLTFFLFYFFPSFFLSFSLLSLSFPFFFLFWRPFGDHGGRGPQSPPKIRPCLPLTKFEIWNRSRNSGLICGYLSCRCFRFHHFLYFKSFLLHSSRPILAVSIWISSYTMPVGASPASFWLDKIDLIGKRYWWLL